jgi:hypothetical protein
VTVRNTGTAPIAGWQVTWALPAGQSVTQLWNGGYTVASGTVTVTNANWNGALAAGATATFGLTGSATAAPTSPTATCSTRWTRDQGRQRSTEPSSSSSSSVLSTAACTTLSASRSRPTWAASAGTSPDATAP